MNTEAIKKKRFWAGAVLYHPEKRMILMQHRDAAAPTNPDTWALFGGVGENGESAEVCLRRELSEELGFDFSSIPFVPLHDYLIEHLGMWRFVYWANVSLEKELFVLGEGAGFDWVPLEQARNLNLAGLATRRDIEAFSQVLKSQ